MGLGIRPSATKAASTADERSQEVTWSWWCLRPNHMPCQCHGHVAIISPLYKPGGCEVYSRQARPREIAFSPTGQGRFYQGFILLLWRWMCSCLLINTRSWNRAPHGMQRQEWYSTSQPQWRTAGSRPASVWLVDPLTGKPHSTPANQLHMYRLMPRWNGLVLCTSAEPAHICSSGQLLAGCRGLSAHLPKVWLHPAVWRSGRGTPSACGLEGLACRQPSPTC